MTKIYVPSVFKENITNTELKSYQSQDNPSFKISLGKVISLATELLYYRELVENFNDSIEEETTFIPINQDSFTKSDTYPKYKSMNLYPKKGDKVVFKGEGGYEIDKQIAFTAGLVKDEIYTVNYVCRGFHESNVYLIGYNSCFNTVLFEDYKEEIKPLTKDEIKKLNDIKIEFVEDEKNV